MAGCNGLLARPGTAGAQSDENEAKRLFILYTHAASMDWNAAGTLIATAASPLSTVRVWDVETLEQRYFVRHGSQVSGILFNPAGDRFLTWSSQEIHLWEAETGRLLGTLAGGAAEVGWRGDRVLYRRGAVVGLWDGVSPESLATFFVPGEEFGDFHAGVSWNPEQTHFLTWNAVEADSPIVRVWAVAGELDTITQVMTLLHADDWIDGAAWSPDGALILSWSKNMVQIWDAAAITQIAALSPTPTPVKTATATPTPGATPMPPRAVMATVVPTPDMTPTPSGEPLHVLNTGGYVTSAEWSPNARYVLVEDIHTWRFRVWDARTGDEVLAVPTLAAQWDTTGDRLLAGRQTVELLDVATGEKLADFGPSLGLGTALWNPDGVRLLVDTAFGVQVWIIPPKDQCVIHALAPTNVRAGPSLDAGRVDVLPPRRIAYVTGQALGTDGFIWWQVADDLWVRSDVVEETGRCH
ncbi:MAG: WD40 repeat domain-containing protein [Chloroflexi bacterium]|nr:WD40 repeat domain-containing protein [Chloroflexota bacterium]